MKVMYGVCVVLLLVGCACASQSTVTVLQLQLTYNEIHTLSINNTIEYILEFTPPQPLPLAAPSLVWVQSVGADTAHPVLVTARQRAGAVTWQIPYESDAHTLYELERTLCPDDTADGGSDSCEGQTRTAFSLHISSACAAPTSLRVRVSQPFVWDLPFARAVTVSATQSMPRVTHYRFIEGQTSVRLIVSSENEVCATLSVQNYSCPIAQTVTDVSTSGLRLTMMRSGAVQLSRSEYPLGFYVVALVLPSEQACGGAAAGERDWLWAAALLGADAARARSLARHKAFTISVEAALTREQYAVAAVVTLFLFLAFYVIFGALVLAQRWPPFAKYVLPKAVLASQTDAIDASAAEQALDGQSEIRSEGTTPARLRRRGSDVTFDSSDNSDSDDSSAPAALPASSTPVGTPAGANQNSSNENRTSTSPASASQVPANESAVTPPAATGRTDVDGAQSAATPNGRTDGTEIQGPFGLPARLRLAALARRGGRTLRARSDRYLYTLYTVAVFYALPVVQFVIAFQIILNVSGSLDICYYNFLCAHRAGALSDFNHVLSNLGYLLLGALFLLQVRRRRLRRKRQPRHQDYGIPAHYGLLSALGAGMMVVAVLSASYHVCPNRLNFQFDTAFMYVLAVLIMVKIYQSRHPDVNARAHATFGVLAVLIALVVWGVLDGGPLFWGVFTVFHVFTFLLLSLRIYYVGQFRLEKESLAQAASELRKGSRPLYRARLVLLLVANALNWMLAIFGLLKQGSDFAGHMLQVLLGNALMYMVFYLAMKLVHGERLRWYAWALLAAAAAAWAPALYFFLSGSTDWSAAPALSRHRNHECMVMQFYDSHDLWHMLSAVALYLSFSALLTWDDGLSAVKRTDIPVF
ncbi:SID1 transmembrane family member 1-like isoform X1 [Nymphalis io]|uniref:SID1 transmembrane family member 1-like isoform X1 n=1 Tax=Inachis io TaxID=171585 RepID=UPI0021698BA8|nr:SID1 transmembrane family member 1-like isoform X1 [Nymphalis io]